MKTLKIAVVGAGHLGKFHAGLLAQMSDVQLVGIVDPLPAARDKVAADARTRAYADHRELISEIDAAVIATPTRFHHAVALDFLRAGKPLLVEKPLCDNLPQADELVETAKRGGVLLQVGHIERFNPAFAAARARIGRPRFVEAVRAAGYTGRSTDIGVVLDLMIHDIDLLLSLVDSPLEQVSALGLAVLGRREDVAHARLEFASGCVANLSASRVSTSQAPRRQMQIWSETGFALVDFGNRSASVITPGDEVSRREFDYEQQSTAEKADFKQRLTSELLREESLTVEPTNALADELRDFVDAVRHQRSPRVTGQDGRDAVAVAEAILDSIRAHRWDGRHSGAVGPLATPGQSHLRGPHWPAVAQPRPAA